MTQLILASASFFNFSSIINFVRKTTESIVQARKARMTYRKLSALTNKELQDIGITRSEIIAISMGIH
jgi:uncharacterized protein YjiS (DUF1127 family)